jgi:hypothetical protein
MIRGTPATRWVAGMARRSGNERPHPLHRGRSGPVGGSRPRELARGGCSVTSTDFVCCASSKAGELRTSDGLRTRMGPANRVGTLRAWWSTVPTATSRQRDGARPGQQAEPARWPSPGCSPGARRLAHRLDGDELPACPGQGRWWVINRSAADQAGSDQGDRLRTGGHHRCS